MLGSVLGRVNFKAWIPFVLLWSSLIYTVNAFLIWGGGYFAQHGAVDFSGGYVIHLAAGVSGFVAAAVIGPRLQRDREVDAPNNLAMVAVGRRAAVARLERLQRRRPVLRPAPTSAAAILNTNLALRVGVPRLGRLGLHHRSQAEPDRQRQRHDHRPRGDHAGRRLRERLGRDRDRRDRHDDRVLRAQLRQPPAIRSGTSTTRSAWSTRTASRGSPAACWSGIFADPKMILAFGIGTARRTSRQGPDPRRRLTPAQGAARSPAPG